MQETPDHIDALAEQLFDLSKSAGRFDDEDGYDMGCAYFQVGLAVLLEVIGPQETREVLEKVAANIEWAERDGKYDA